MTQTLVTANVSELASQRILARLLPVRPPRHRERRTECRQQFPSVTGQVPASTGKAAITIYPAGQITYADGHTTPRSMPGRWRHFLAAADLTSRHRRKTHPARGPGASPERHPGCRYAPRYSQNPGDLKKE